MPIVTLDFERGRRYGQKDATRRFEEFVREIYGMFGWQGGTIHQLREEVARLRRVDENVKRGQETI